MDDIIGKKLIEMKDKQRSIMELMLCMCEQGKTIPDSIPALIIFSFQVIRGLEANEPFILIAEAMFQMRFNDTMYDNNITFNNYYINEEVNYTW